MIFLNPRVSVLNCDSYIDVDDIQKPWSYIRLAGFTHLDLLLCAREDLRVH